MIKIGVIKPSDSEWSSALHMVPKKMETGDHVATTAVRMLKQYQIGTRYRIIKTLPSASPEFSRK